VVRQLPATTRHLQDVDFVSVLGNRNLRVNGRLREDVYGLTRPAPVRLKNAVNLLTVRACNRSYGPSFRKNTGRFDALQMTCNAPICRNLEFPVTLQPELEHLLQEFSI
jgi:hypothetical protein